MVECCLNKSTKFHTQLVCGMKEIFSSDKECV